MLTPLILAVLLQALSPQEVQQAIADGAKLKGEPHKIGLILRGADGGFDVWLRGPYARIVTRSAEAAAKYQEVGEVQTDSTIEVFASPKPPTFRPYGSSWAITPAATGLVLRTAAGQIVQPEATMLVPVAFSNASGGSIQGSGIKATFAPDSLPAGEFTVVVTTADHSERAYTVKAKDRAKVR